MPKPTLTDMKKQLQDVKAMSPQKPGRPLASKQLCAPVPDSPTHSSTALADLKNQLNQLKLHK